MSRPYTRREWTTSEVAQLRELYGTIPRAEVAARMGRTERSIAGQAQKLGIARTIATPSLSLAEMREAKAAGEHVASIARRAGVSRGTVYRALETLGVELDGNGSQGGMYTAGSLRAHAEEDVIVELYEAHVASSEIADAYATEPATVLSILRRRGVAIRRGGGMRTPAAARSSIAALHRHGLLEYASGALRRTRAWREHAETVAARSRAQDRNLGYDDVPAGPLAAAIRAWCAERGIDKSDVISGETIGRWEQPGMLVAGAVADRWCSRLELLWFDVWPDDAAAHRYFTGEALEVAA